MRGANSRRVYNKDQHDKIGSSSSSRRYASAKYDKKTRSGNNHDKKGKDWINIVVDHATAQVSEAGAYYHGDTASITKPERKRTEAKQKDGNDHQTVTDAKYRYRYTAEVNVTRQKTRPFKGKTSQRNNPQGTRLHGQSESARGSHGSKRDYMSPYYDHQEAPCDLSMQRPNSSRRPFYGESTKPHNTESRQRSKEQGAIATAKSSKRDYKYQKEEVFRTHGHRNPVQSSQASVLIEQLRNETYECMVCCDRIRCSAAVWSCHNCHHLFHLGCVRKWAKSSANANAMGGMIPFIILT